MVVVVTGGDRGHGCDDGTCVGYMGDSDHESDGSEVGEMIVSAESLPVALDDGAIALRMPPGLSCCMLMTDVLKWLAVGGKGVPVWCGVVELCVTQV